MDTINLGIFAPEFFPVWGGTGSYIVELVKNLPANVNIQIITLNRQISDMASKELTQNQISKIIKRPVEIHYVSSSKETFFYNLPFQIACFRKMASLQKQYHLDILHSQLAHMPDLFIQLLRASKLPTVLTIHSTMQMLRDYAFMAKSLFGNLEASERNSLLFSPILSVVQQQYIKNIANFIAVSEMTRKFVIKELKVEPEKISLIYNGVDTEIFHPPNKEEAARRYSDPTIVYIGRMVAKKGINTLIDAIPQVLRYFPKARFLFVGGGNISAFKAIAAGKGIPESNYAFLGHLGYFERLIILREATIFVNPSLFENCSLSILEAMSSGCSVVASNVGGNPELISSGVNGLLTPMLNSGRLAQNILSLLQDDNFNYKIGQEARRTVERSFSSKKCAMETYENYRKVLS